MSEPKREDLPAYPPPPQTPKECVSKSVSLPYYMLGSLQVRWSAPLAVLVAGIILFGDFAVDPGRRQGPTSTVASR